MWAVCLRSGGHHHLGTVPLQIVVAYNFCIQIDVTDLVRGIVLTVRAGYRILPGRVGAATVFTGAKLGTTLCHFPHGFGIFFHDGLTFCAHMARSLLPPRYGHVYKIDVFVKPAS